MIAQPQSAESAAMTAAAMQAAAAASGLSGLKQHEGPGNKNSYNNNNINNFRYYLLEDLNTISYFPLKWDISSAPFLKFTYPLEKNLTSLKSPINKFWSFLTTIFVLTRLRVYHYYVLLSEACT